MVNVEETPLITYDVDECNMGKSALAYAEEIEDLMLLDFPDILHLLSLWERVCCWVFGKQVLPVPPHSSQ